MHTKFYFAKPGDLNFMGVSMFLGYVPWVIIPNNSCFILVSLSDIQHSWVHTCPLILYYKASIVNIFAILSKKIHQYVIIQLNVLLRIENDLLMWKVAG